MQDDTELLLLLPKVRPPRLASKMVLRSRLAQYAKAIEDVPLAVVSAPSGFGKTTIAAAWARELKSRSAIVSWLGLDKEDNEPTRFFNYLAFAIHHALREHSADAKAGRHVIQSPLKGNRLIANLINSIAEEGGEFFLFLDDFQVIAEGSIRASMQFLVRNAPPNFHLVILSHPHGVADFSSGKPGTELRLDASDLRFTEMETRELFQVYSRQHEQAALAYTLTGGWAAALRILAASNIGSDGRAAEAKACLLTEDDIGNLLRVVLSGLTSEEIRLIEMTCITGKMCGPLFSGLSGTSQPRNIIHSVEHTHCLISRVSEDGYWFGCHDLIRESVMFRLSETNPSLIQDVAQRASRWYATQGYWAEAVTQALAVNNRELALQTIETCSAKLLYKGDILTLIGWESRLGLSRIPTTTIKTLTVLALALVMAADHEQNADLGELIDLIDARMRHELPPEAIDRVHWHLHGIRSILACRNDDVAVALKLASECLDQPEIFPSLTQSVRCAAGYSYYQFRQWGGFHKVMTEVSRTVDDDFTFVSSLYRQMLLGLASITQLKLDRGMRYLEEVHQTAYKTLGATSLPGALAGGLMAFIHCERLEMSRAENLLGGGNLDLVAQSGYIDCICRAYTAALRTAMLRNENEYALSLLEKWERIVSGPHAIRPQIICAYEKMCFFLHEKNYIRAGANLAHIQHLYDSAKARSDILPVEMNSYRGLAHGQCALAVGHLAEAKDHLGRVYDNAVSDDDGYMLVLSAMALALAEFKAGSNEDAFNYLSKALTLAQDAGMKASILCQPGDIWPLLDAYKRDVVRHTGSGRHDAYIDDLKEAHNANSNSAPVNLSPREESVLRLIAQDKSNKEISIALSITPETVKTHLKSIFVKLNVTKRNAAVRRANAIKLLRDDAAGKR
jgi:LuxR family maltose regulon positive regulatory protein